VEIVSIETPSLGDRSYLVHDGTVGLVVDPQRDIDRVEQAFRDAGVRLSHVAETHVHNDYVSGGLVLAQRLGAEYLVGAAEQVGFERRPVTDGEELAIGELTVRAVAAPGHTRHHMAYVVSGGGRTAAFSGGSLLYGSVGRTDLEDPALTVELTHAQYRSARRLADLAGDPASLHPTHGFGSFCSSGPATSQASSTIGEQRTVNDALSTDDEEHFVRQLIVGLNAYPSYYAHVGPINRAGGSAADLTVPRPVDPAAPTSLSTYRPQPINGESPTRPGIFHARPLVVVTPLMSKVPSSARQLMVPVGGLAATSAAHARMSSRRRSSPRA